MANFPREPTGDLFGLPKFVPVVMDSNFIDLLLLSDSCLSCFGPRKGNKLSSSSSAIVLSLICTVPVSWAYDFVVLVVCMRWLELTASNCRHKLLHTSVQTVLNILLNILKYIKTWWILNNTAKLGSSTYNRNMVAIINIDILLY